MLPCGTRALTYEEDKAIVRTRLQWFLFVSFLLLLFACPLFLPLQFLGMLNWGLIVLVAVVGLQITTGYLGQINLGQAAFMGVGAYVTAFAASNFDFPFWLAIPAGGIGAAIFGTLFGLPAVRVKGFYLALTTLAGQFIFAYAFFRLPGFGGAGGLGVEPASIGDFKFVTTQSQYYLILVVALIMVYFAYGVVRSRIGRAFTAIRDNDNAAQILGINLIYYKTLGFVIGASFAGVAGGLLAYYLRFVRVDQFALWDSLWYLAIIIVGGMGSILGAILGTFFIRCLFELVTYLGPILSQSLPGIGASIWFASMSVLLGGLIVLFIIFEPRGLIHWWNIFKTKYRLWPFPY
jgi:branched-chain amino acid transport system permease protein